MQYANKKYLGIAKDAQMLVNLIIVIFHSAIFMTSTNYICSNGYERIFIERLSSLPAPPEKAYLECVASCVLLIILIKGKWIKNKNVLTVAELILSIFIIIRLNGSYNGIILMILVNRLSTSMSNRETFENCLVFGTIFIITDYSFLTTFIALPSLSTYISYLPSNEISLIVFMQNILVILNVVLFIVFLLITLLIKEKEKEEVSEELAYVSEVNEQLRIYAQLTEKISEENERKRISREIHDTLGHALTGILAGVDACRVLIDIDPEKTKKQLEIVSNVVRQGIQDVRGSLQKLRPGVLEESSLKNSLEKMMKEFEEVSNIKIIFYYGWSDVDLEKTKEDIVYRIIQESITNALRHGEATLVEVDMFQDDYHYLIAVQDNGKGCEKIHYGYGLKQMQERVAILDGKISFSGEHGFRVMVEFRK